jgi:signal peptidase II
MNTENKKNIPLKFLFLGIMIIIIDQVSKKIALLYNFFTPSSIYRIFHLPPIKNSRFTLDFISIENVSVYYFVNFITTLFVIYLATLIFHGYKNKNIYGEVCILAGGISNLIDRFCYGAVIDFIVFKIPLINYFAIGNIADIVITIGIIIFMTNLIIE